MHSLILFEQMDSVCHCMLIMMLNVPCNLPNRDFLKYRVLVELWYVMMPCH